MEENQKGIQRPQEAAIDFGAIWQAIKKYKKLYLHRVLYMAFKSDIQYVGPQGNLRLWKKK